jgi:hypothetical protein
MFEVGEKIYIKKYFGNTLKADTSKIYTIVELIPREQNMEVLLDNGKIHYLIENGTVYGEKVETNYFCWFCM